jgi:hypothetical protein
MIVPRAGRDCEDAKQIVAEPGSGLGPDRWRDSEDGHDPTKRRGDFPEPDILSGISAPELTRSRNNVISSYSRCSRTMSLGANSNEVMGALSRRNVKAHEIR